jgi:hypothetical protein
MTRPIVVITLSTDQIRDMIHSAVREALALRRTEEANDSTGLSASAAAKLAHKRRALVAAAMGSGSLKATRSGRAWLTTAGAVRDWIERGAPEVA